LDDMVASSRARGRGGRRGGHRGVGSFRSRLGGRRGFAGRGAGRGSFRRSSAPFQKRESTLTDDTVWKHDKFQEQEEETRKMFNANKRAFFLMKEDINKGKLTYDKISPLFRDKFPIFEYLDEKNLLTKLDDGDDDCDMGLDYVLYRQLTSQSETSKSVTTDGYVPHNIHYLNEEEQKKYSVIMKKNKDVIEEFISKYNKVKPLNQILKELDDVGDDNNDDNNDDYNEDEDEDEDNENTVVEDQDSIPELIVSGDNNEPNSNKIQETVDKIRNILKPIA